MSDQKIPENVELLSEKERKLLAKAIRRIEADLFNSVIGRLQVAVGVALGVLTVFGIASISTIKQAVVDASASKIASQGQVIQDVEKAAVEQLAQGLQEFEDLKREISEARANLRSRQGRAVALVDEDLKELLQMIHQIEEEVGQRFISTSTETDGETQKSER